MRLGATKTGATTTYNGLGDQLYDLGGARPTLDLNFASNGSLVDSVTGKTLVTHTRASNATYVDGDGIIKDAVTNSLTWSEDFDNANWATVGTVTVDDDADVSPYGANTADKLSFSSASYIRQEVSGISSGATYTISAWVKKTATGGADAIRFTSNNTTAWSTGFSEKFTLTTDWQRFTATGVLASSGSEAYVILGGKTEANVTDSDCIGDVLIWGAQLEQASTAGEYVKTTSTINSAPRFDHNPTTGESLGLLVEESRTNLLEYSEDITSWSQTTGGGVVLTANSASDPAGGNTATLIENDGNAGFIGDTTSWELNTTYTISGYLKAGTGDKAAILLYSSGGNSGNWNSEASNVAVTFNLTNGTSETFSNAVAPTSSSITDAGNGWWRCSITATCTGANTNSQQLIRNMSGTTDGIYAWGFQIEEGSFPTSYIRTSGTVGVRAADVTSIEGNDFGTFNLLQYSEEFDNAGWSKTRASIVSNDVIAPDGTATADRLIEDTSTNTHQCTQTITVTASTAYTLSLYAKAKERTKIGLYHGGAGGAAQGIIVDLSDGTFVTNLVNAPSSYSITSTGNGWYRIAVTATTTGTALNAAIYTVNDSNNFNYTGDGTSGVYLWGAQLEESSTATPYVKSDVTFTSRGSTATYYDYNGIIRTAAVDEARNVAFLPDGSGNFVSAGELLLEDAGTNPVDYSEEFDQWTQTNIELNPNQVVAPDGTLTADEMLATSGVTGVHRVEFAHVFTAAGTKTASVYVKNKDAEGIQLNLYNPTDGNQAIAVVDFSDYSVTVGSGTVTPVGNGWYRISITGDYSAIYTQLFIQLRKGGTNNFEGDGKGVYLWGAQLETGSYATSYIPTYGSEATRAADVSSSSSNTFGNSFYNQTEGTVAVSWNKPWGGNWPSYQSFFVVEETANPTENVISFGTTNGANNQIYWGAKTSNVAQLSYKQYPATGPNSFKHAIAIASNDAAFAYAGAISGRTDDSITLPTVDKADIEAVNSHISRLTYWPTRLSNDTLETITV